MSVACLIMSKKGTPRDKLTKEQRLDVITRYLDGEPYESLAKRFGVTDSAVWAIVARAQVPRTRWMIREDEWTRADKLCVERRHAQGAPHDPIWSTRTKRLNLASFMRLTTESAYWLGMIVSDGSILVRGDCGSKTLVLQLTEPDGYHVEAFRSFLGSTHKITEIAAGITSQGLRRRKAYRFAISSTALVESIESYGIGKDKTYNIRLPETLKRHPDFWRGVIDGDGSIRKRDNAFQVVGSPDLVGCFAEFCLDLFPKAAIRITKRGKIDVFETTGKTAAILLRAMYDTSGPALLRKKDRAEKIYNNYPKL